jgi:predicted chitinase
MDGCLTLQVLDHYRSEDRYGGHPENADDGERARDPGTPSLEARDPYAMRRAPAGLTVTHQRLFQTLNNGS